MCDDKKDYQKMDVTEKSLNGIENLRPVDTNDADATTNSLNGIEELRPDKTDSE